MAVSRLPHLPCNSGSARKISMASTPHLHRTLTHSHSKATREAPSSWRELLKHQEEHASARLPLHAS